MRFRPAAFFDDQFRLHQGVEIRNLVERHKIRFKAINHGTSLNAGSSMSLTNSALCPVLTFQSAAKDVFSARSRKGVRNPGRPRQGQQYRACRSFPDPIERHRRRPSSSDRATQARNPLHHPAELNTALIRRVLNTHSYREKAQYFKNIIAHRRGPESAAGTIERAFEAALADCALEPARS